MTRPIRPSALTSSLAPSVCAQSAVTHHPAAPRSGARPGAGPSDLHRRGASPGPPRAWQQQDPRRPAAVPLHCAALRGAPPRSDPHRPREVCGIPQPEQRQAHLRSGLHPEREHGARATRPPGGGARLNTLSSSTLRHETPSVRKSLRAASELALIDVRRVGCVRRGGVRAHPRRLRHVRDRALRGQPGHRGDRAGLSSLVMHVMIIASCLSEGARWVRVGRRRLAFDHEDLGGAHRWGRAGPCQ